MSAMESLLKPRCLLLALLTIAALPSASIAKSCLSNFAYSQCFGTNTYCCKYTHGGTSSCCNYAQYTYTSSVSRYGNSYAYTSCYNLYSYRKCYQATESRCCYRTAGESSSCCDYSDWSFTSSLYRGGSTYSSGSWIGYVVGGVIGGIVFLILIIVIPCGACAAAGTRGTTGRTTVVTYNNQPNQAYNNQPNQAYNNQGYSQGPPPPGYGQPPPQGPPHGYSQAPPQHGQMYPPPQQYPPPSAVDPAYPPK